MSNTLETEFLVVGGGIAGVSCAELLSTLAPQASITLITSGPMVKAVTDFSHLTKLLATFDVVEQSVDEWGEQNGGVKVFRGKKIDKPMASKVLEKSMGSIECMLE